MKLGEDKDNKKAREGFIEACRVIELMDFKEVEGLAETMFKGEETKEKTNTVALSVAKQQSIFRRRFQLSSAFKKVYKSQQCFLHGMTPRKGLQFFIGMGSSLFFAGWKCELEPDGLKQFLCSF